MWFDLLLVITGFCWTLLKCSCGACLTRLLHQRRRFCWSYDIVWEHACWQSRFNAKQWIGWAWKSADGSEGTIHRYLASLKKSYYFAILNMHFSTCQNLSCAYKAGNWNLLLQFLVVYRKQYSDRNMLKDMIKIEKQ